jgi:hypothetical protein
MKKSGGMFSIQQLFGNSDRLYELLEMAAVETHKSTQLLAASLNSRGGSEISSELAAVHQILGEICATI